MHGIQVRIVARRKVLVTSVGHQHCHYLLVAVGSPLYLIESVALAVLEHVHRRQSCRTNHYAAAFLNEVQAEHVLHVLHRIPDTLVVDVHVLIGLLVIRGGRLTEILRIELTGLRLQCRIAAATRQRPRLARRHEHPSVGTRDAVRRAISVGVHLQPVGKVVHGLAEERELRQRTVVNLVVVQNVVKHPHVGELIAQRHELHVVINETLAIRAPAGLLNHRRVVVDDELLSSVHDVVADFKANGNGTANVERHTRLAHPLAVILQLRQCQPTAPA